MTPTTIHQLTEHDAFGHRAYNSGLARAVERAAQEDACMSLYYDGAAIFVRDSKAAAPPQSILVCIAQRWDEATVQLRFSGARSEWVKVPTKENTNGY